LRQEILYWLLRATTVIKTPVIKKRNVVSHADIPFKTGFGLKKNILISTYHINLEQFSLII
jgi:hypothetical protein